MAEPIIVSSPQGIAPFYDPRTLPSENAQIAENCVVKRGVVEPLKDLQYIQALGSETKTIYNFNGTWLEFNEYVDVIESPVNAENDRYYFTSPNGPQKKDTSLASPLPLGIPQPSAGPTTSFDGTAEEDASIKFSTVYIYTRVTAWGEESAPSRPSGLVEPDDGQYITFSGLDDNGDTHITHYRLYRSVTGTEGTGVFSLVPYQTTAGEIQYNADNEIIYDIPKSDIGLMQDGVDDDWLGEALQTRNWYEPPEDLANLTDAGNGIILGSSGKEVCFSEPWIPYAWPGAYRYSLNNDVVAVSHINGVPIAFTNSSVYIFEGSTPDSLQQRKLSETQGCVNKNSVVSTKYGVFFASKDGLCLATLDSVKNITETIWTKDQWNQKSLTSLYGTFHDGAYIAFFTGSTQGFIMPMGKGRGSEVTTFILSQSFTSAFMDSTNDKLYLNASNLYEFNADSNLVYKWKSKQFQTVISNFSTFIIIGDTGQSTITYWLDGQEQFSEIVDHNSAIRIPVFQKGRVKEIQVEGSTPWAVFGLANSVRELRANGI